MTQKHAIVEVSGYEIPLIGIPVGETLETCDLCGDVFSIWQVELTRNGKQFLCKRYRSTEKEILNRRG